MAPSRVSEKRKPHYDLEELKRLVRQGWWRPTKTADFQPLMYKNGDMCPICGVGTIKVERKPETFEYKGKTLTLELTVYSCDVCGEGFFDDEEMRKHQKIIKDFQRRVDGLLTSEEIKQIREKYGLSQRELARILGVAEKSIAKYEGGFVAQSKAMDNLLRIIGEFPEVLEFLKKPKEKIKTLAKAIDFEK